ncbi:methyltransferase domain-containing protein [Schlesneria sp.]|uniref:methyltransferase domain-containing protein n=1 Tax=Schlesneria sp. TaxID=2762018 RepID=UPI002EDD2224
MKILLSRLGLDLSERRLQPEWMDQPGLDADFHRTALLALGRINAMTSVHRSFWPVIRRMAAEDPTRELRVLDVACGGGDLAVRLALCARRENLRVTVDGCDISPTAIGLAQERARTAGVNCHFFQFDVQRGVWPTDYDVIGTSLFLHHLTNDDAVRLLRTLATATKRGVIVHDLVRGYYGYLMARYAVWLVTFSPIVHSDGPDSVEGAFTANELQDMAERAGLHGATISRSWPARMQLEWKKP